MDQLLNWIGLGVLAPILLLVVAVIWYRAGSLAAKIVAFVSIASVALLKVKRYTELEREAKDNAESKDRIAKSVEARRASRNHSNAGGLRDDDGYRRD